MFKIMLALLSFIPTRMAGAEPFYSGNIKIYIAEPVSWDMANGEPYHYGFQGFALDEWIEFNDVWDTTIEWYNDCPMAIGVLFNNDSTVKTNATGEEFICYPVDAVAGALINEEGYSESNYTHKVFVEQGSVSTCYKTTYVEPILYSLFQTGDFFYVNLVADKNSVALDRLCYDYNINSVPHTFFDGGYCDFSGRPTSPSVYMNLIDSCGNRIVPGIDLYIFPQEVGGHSEIYIRAEFIDPTIVPMDYRLPTDYDVSIYPNPFNSNVQVECTVPVRSYVSVDIYNILGQKIKTLVNGELSVGRYRFDWSTNEASGVYFCKVQIGTFVKGQSIVLMK